MEVMCSFSSTSVYASPCVFLLSLDANCKSLCLSRPLPDQVGPTGVGFEQIVSLLPLHVPCKPESDTVSETLHLYR